ncbi:MAG: nucleotidyltransferase family protein [Armatimonadota bacterium]|nr:nucleotidyltransferase family protein [Armatimonadota bacterium]MDR7453566.1 nucleotidyltransferase family protein [Armatimonadota bacterium]MDR7456388.1 nucleotidyltransferase family protein [Armatimonadota bacterium]MDR7496684.1 nucleotidyltransferase family protein [Armatimonadota bacterium]MDR7511502.1 nucleotidyltransferase family protein [Armatimonadota bacterium]
MQAIILAGGRGERLRPYTEDRPKPMVEILGVPILAYQLHWLQTQGIVEVVMACGYRHEVIRDYFGTGEKWGLRIAYAVEEQPLGRGGAIRRAYGLLAGAPELVLATNGDVITNLRLGPVVAHHQHSGGLATLVLTPYISQYGLVEVNAEDRVIAFHEKPTLPYWVNAGVYVLSRAAVERFPEVGDHETTIFPALAEQRLLVAYRSRDYWRAVDTVKDLTEISRELERRLLTSFLA